MNRPIRCAGPAVFLVLLMPSAASAHPLGLPAFAQISVTGPRAVTITWNAASDDVAKLAHSLGVPNTGPLLTREQDAAFARSTRLRAALLSRMHVSQHRVPCAQTPEDTPSVVINGVTVRFLCPDPIDTVTVAITLLHDLDGRYRTLAGATGPLGKTSAMFTAAVPEHELRLVRPSAMADAPPTSVFGASGPGGLGSATWLERPFIAAIDARSGFAAVLIGILIALGVGAVHALAPGHGKAIAAAYLVGERGRVRHALVMGATVAAMHTGSVLVLGFALYSAARRPDMKALTSWMQGATGAVFSGLGGWLVARRWRERRARAVHAHEVVAPTAGSWQRVVALGAAGGLLPSPAALLVLLTALALGRLAYGLILVAAFSLGLAASLTLIGVAVVRGRDVAGARMAGRLHALAHVAPALGSVVVLGFGLVLFGRALLQLV